MHIPFIRLVVYKSYSDWFESVLCLGSTSFPQPIFVTHRAMYCFSTVPSTHISTIPIQVPNLFISKQQQQNTWVNICLSFGTYFPRDGMDAIDLPRMPILLSIPHKSDHPLTSRQVSDLPSLFSSRVLPLLYPTLSILWMLPWVSRLIICLQHHHLLR